MQATAVCRACTTCIALAILLLLYLALTVAPDGGTATTMNRSPAGSRHEEVTLFRAGGTHTPNVSSPESSFKETHRSMDSDGSDDSFSPLRGVRASSPLRGARAPSPLARQWILGATPIGHP